MLIRLRRGLPSELRANLRAFIKDASGEALRMEVEQWAVRGWLAAPSLPSGARQRAWREANPDKARAYNRFKSEADRVAHRKARAAYMRRRRRLASLL